MKKMLSFVLSLNFLFFVLSSNTAFAQDSDDIIKNTQNDILIVASAGAAGAILGLSTLSFVDKPSQHISNVWTGAAIGVIAGVVFVAYNSAQKGSEELMSKKDFSSSERFVWHSKHTNKLPNDPTRVATNFFNLNF